MYTAVIQIGNTDDKLSQVEWCNFCKRMQEVISLHSHKIHFGGGSPFDAPWQNACWACEVEVHKSKALQEAVIDCRKQYRQDSVAFTFGETVML